MQQACRQVLEFVGGRRAFLELVVGPKLPQLIQLDPSTCAFPVAPIGNRLNIDYGRHFLGMLGIPIDMKFAATAVQQGAPFNDSAAVVYADLQDEEYELAGTGQLQKVLRYRALLALYAGAPFTPIMRMKWNEPTIAQVEFLPPKYRRGLNSRQPDDPISAEFISACSGEHASDDQLHYFISLLVQSAELSDEHFRVARMYSLLETLAASITSQFERKAGKPMTRAAIRFMTGYFMDFDVPRFTVGPATDYEFDHIELAGLVRHKIFHGGGPLKRSDVPEKLQIGVDLLHRRPDLIAHALRRDCETELVGWAKHESRAWQARNGIEFAMPSRDPDYDGKTLAKRLISSPEPIGSPIGSVNVKVTGNDIGVVRLQIIQAGGE